MALLGDLMFGNRPRHSPQLLPNLPFIGMEHVEPHTMTLLGTGRASDMRSSAIHFQPGDVLYGRLRPYLNKVFRPSFEGLCSAEFIVFPSSPHFNSSYLQYFLNSSAFVAFASHLNTGDRPRIDFEQIAEHPIPLPPLAEQSRIVAAIEEHLSRLDAAVIGLKRVRARLVVYREAVLKAAVEGKLVPHGSEPWAPTKLGDVAVSLRNGISAKPDEEDGQRILRISAVRPLSVNLDDVRYLPPSDEWLAYRLEEGDLLFTRYNGNPALVGVCGMFRQRQSDTVYPDKLIRMRVNLGRCVPRFIEIAVNSGESRQFIRSRARTTAGQSGISGSDLKQTPIRLPGLNEQIEIASEAEGRLSIAGLVSAQVDVTVQRAQQVRQSILSRAFSGTLVLQNPKDEPASVLLKRIRSERSSEANRPPKARKRQRIPSDPKLVP
jgi:type I restriction enzyme S subunit